MSATERKRFYKPVCYIDKPRKPIKCLSEIFGLFELPDIREDITLWLQVSLSTEGHVYDEGWEREELIEYCTRLMPLCEACFVIYDETPKAKKERRKLKASKEIRKNIALRRRPTLLTEEEMKDPYSVINDFCRLFSKNYAATQLSDMVDAVITYGGERKFYKGNIILLYRCLRSLLKLVRTIHLSQIKL